MDDCSDCRFWHRLGEAEGICRRYPPTRLHDVEPKEHQFDGPEFYGYPITLDCMWCGEHRLK